MTCRTLRKYPSRQKATGDRGARIFFLKRPGQMPDPSRKSRKLLNKIHIYERITYPHRISPSAGERGSMDKSAFPDDLQDLIGYRFHNEKILEDAMTSRAGEPPAQKKGCTEPLAAVGDAVLDAVVTCKLYESLMQGTGEITVQKPEDIKLERTRTFAEKHQLMRYVQGCREMTQEEIWITGIKQNDMVTEALVGAVFVDAEQYGRNGFIVVKKVLDDLGYF